MRAVPAGCCSNSGIIPFVPSRPGEHLDHRHLINEPRGDHTVVIDSRLDGRQEALSSIDRLTFCTVNGCGGHLRALPEFLDSGGLAQADIGSCQLLCQRSIPWPPESCADTRGAYRGNPFEKVSQRKKELRKVETAVSSDELDSPGSGSKPSTLAGIITAQFGKAWDLLAEAVRNFTAEEWRSGDLNYLIPARITYHIIETADYYLRDDLTAFKWGWRFGVDWQTASAAELPDQRGILAYLHEIRRQAAEWITNLGDEELLKADSAFGAEGMSHLDRTLYVLRHTHQHLGELFAELRRRDRARPAWR